MTPVNEDRVIGLLKELDERLSANMPGKKIDLYVFGGAATVICYGARRSTVDVDLLASDDATGRKLLEWGHKNSPLHREYDVYVDPANTTLMVIEDPAWKRRVVEMLPGRFKSFRVLALGKEDLILSKLARYEARDQSDIEYLAKHGADPDKLLEGYKVAREYYVGDLQEVDLTFKLVMSNCFGRDDIRLYEDDRTLAELNQAASKGGSLDEGPDLSL